MLTAPLDELEAAALAATEAAEAAELDLSARRLEETTARAAYDESAREDDLDQLLRASARRDRSERIFAEKMAAATAAHNRADRERLRGALERINEVREAMNFFPLHIVAKFGRKFAALDAKLEALAVQVVAERDALIEEVQDAARLASQVSIPFDSKVASLEDVRAALGVALSVSRIEGGRDDVNGWLDAVSYTDFRGPKSLYDQLIITSKGTD